MLYSGATNPIVGHRKYLESYACDFELSLYPFDEQQCYMIFKIGLASASVLQFDIHRSMTSYLGPKILLEYEVRKIQQETYFDSDYSVLRVKIILLRLRGFAFINVYIPTSTMLIIGYLTLFFKQDIFEVRIMVALTAMLVVVTLSAQV